jgi:aminopeptidase N
MKKIATLFAFLFFAAFANAKSDSKISFPENSFSDPTPLARWNAMQTQASNTISDTIDILHYTVKLNITDFVSDTIRGGTTIKFTPRMNGVTILPLDLLHMTIDSIVENNSLLTYTYTDTLLKVNLPITMNIGDTANMAVWYHGKPQLDPGPNVWGGFYFQSPYAYNLGVSFNSDPHCFGRVFHPCFDNFVERASYTFVIGTNNGHTSYCNGVLGADTTDVNNVRWRTWDLAETIPSYLASISTANYTQVNWTHNGIYGSYPIILTALPSDTTNMKNSFVHLNNALDAFENRYGPYEWPRVGYCLVPFSGGAMEHASNISYPRLAANGSLTYEAEIMAHELSHHWFGDLATCNNEGEMWLNEGWATYSQYIFTEWVYGHTAYENGIRDNHDEAIHEFHHREGGYRAVSGIPHSLTYGDHVYKKGADVAHSLRGYMGDSLFFLGLHYHLAQRQYTDVTSAQFRDDLIAATGLTYLNDFFDDWVFNGGWAHFGIDSTVVVPNGPNYDVTVYVRQKLTGAPNYFTNVPLDFTFLKSDWSKTTFREFVSGQYSNFTITIPYNPVMTAIDMDGKISDAITDEAQVIKTTGAHNFISGRVNFTVNSITDSAFVRVEHNWAAADSIRNNPNNYRISSLRFWKIDGIFPANFYAKARFYYDGRTTSMSGPSMYLDNDLTPLNGDSIILLYRKDASDEWHEYPHYTKTITGPHLTSKYGFVDADSIVKGEYAFACGVSTVIIGVNELADVPSEVTAYPNPAGNNITVEWPGATNDPLQLNIYDLDGKLVFSEIVTGEQARIETEKWMDGMYIIEAVQNEKRIGKKQVMILH